MGDCETGTLVSVESTLKYHPVRAGLLTTVRESDLEQRQVGSLTGAVASQNVTEAPKSSYQAGWQSAVECKGTRELDCETDMSSRSQLGLVIRQWHVEALSLNGFKKGTPGITGL